MPKEKENKTLSAWQKRNIYAKQLAVNNKSKLDNPVSKPNITTLKSVENSALKSQPISKKRIASTSASLLQVAKKTRVEINARPVAKPTPRIVAKSVINPRKPAVPLKVDSGLVKFTAKPVSLPKRNPIKQQTPTRRQTILRKNTPRASLAPALSKRKPNKYLVPSRIDTGLKKKITAKVIVTPQPNTDATPIILQDLANPTPGTSTGILVAKPHLAPRTFIIAKPDTPASKPKATKKRKRSFGVKSNKRRSLKSVNTPVLSAKRAKMIANSEKKLDESFKKIVYLGQEVQKHIIQIKSINQASSLTPQADSKAIYPPAENVEESFEIAAETLPEPVGFLEDEVFEPCTSLSVITTPADAASIKKRSKSKSVSFKVPADTDRIRTVLPRTPRNLPSLRTGLKDFAAKVGMNTSRMRHLHCLGAELSGMKKKAQPATNITQQSTPTLRIKSTKPAQETSPVQPTETDLQCALKELKTAILEGLKIEQAENWLEDIENFYPHYQVLSKCTFWECKALVEEKKENFEAALEIYNQASSKITEDEIELFQDSLGDFLSRAQSKEDADKENTSRKTRKPRKSELDTSKIFDSKLVKFISAKNASSVKRVFEYNSTPDQLRLVLTPVRRSARLSMKNTAKSGLIAMEEISKDDLAKTLFVPNSFLE